MKIVWTSLQYRLCVLLIPSRSSVWNISVGTGFSINVFQKLFINIIFFTIQSFSCTYNCICFTTKPISLSTTNFQPIKRKITKKSVNMWIFILSLPGIWKQYLFNRFSKKYLRIQFLFYRIFNRFGDFFWTKNLLPQ